MHISRQITVLAGLVLSALPACSTEVTGQLMLAIQTDMSLPKDIDQIRIDVTYDDTGATAYQRDFDKLGSNDGTIRLPATLGLIAPENPDRKIKIRVIARHGSDESVRVMREVVTTVPLARTAVLPISIEFLCDGSAEAERGPNGMVKRDASGNVVIKNNCPDEMTCVAGSCVVREVPSESLHDFKEEDVFGGGTGEGDGICFDTAQCFADATNAELNLEEYTVEQFKNDPTAVCKATAAGQINVALRTQGGGICGPSGCFVALDAESDSGWKAAGGGTIVLPRSICAKTKEGEIAGVVTAPVLDGTCGQKKLSVPTCGPWSASGTDAYTPPDANQAMPLAPGQTNPSALALTSHGTLYWTNRGTFDTSVNPPVPNNDGTVKSAPVDGGEPVRIAEAQGSPHGIAVDNDRGFVLWTNAGSGEIMWASMFDPSVKPLRDNLGLLQPEGIAFQSPTLYWTDLASNKVYKVDTTLDMQDLVIPAGNDPVVINAAVPGTAPHGIAAANDAVCWTYRDELMTSLGIVACALSNMTLPLATGQRTPQAIAMRTDAGGNAASLYWANFDSESADPNIPGGEIFEVVFQNGQPVGSPVSITKEDHPSGIAFEPDGKTLYWTSWSRGVVKMKDESGTTVLADHQQYPGAIIASADAVFWVNEGTGTTPDGAIMKYPKNPPANP